MIHMAQTAIRYGSRNLERIPLPLKRIEFKNRKKKKNPTGPDVTNNQRISLWVAYPLRENEPKLMMAQSCCFPKPSPRGSL